VKLVVEVLLKVPDAAVLYKRLGKALADAGALKS
jgi:hypothetical protein